jgi:hypothetical protein
MLSIALERRDPLVAILAAAVGLALALALALDRTQTLVLTLALRLLAIQSTFPAMRLTVTRT